MDGLTKMTIEKAQLILEGKCPECELEDQKHSLDCQQLAPGELLALNIHFVNSKDNTCYVKEGDYDKLYKAHQDEQARKSGNNIGRWLQRVFSVKRS